VGTCKPVSEAERARRGIFPFDSACQDYRPPPSAPPYRDVDADVKDYFRQCFVDGPRNPIARPRAEDWAGLLRHLPLLSKKRHTVSPRPAPTSPAVATAAPPSARAYTNLAAALLLLLGSGILATWLDSRFPRPANPLPPSIADSPWTAEMLSPSYPASSVEIAPVLDRFRRQAAQPKRPKRRIIDPNRSFIPNKETIP